MVIHVILVTLLLALVTLLLALVLPLGLDLLLIVCGRLRINIENGNFCQRLSKRFKCQWTMFYQSEN